MSPFDPRSALMAKHAQHVVLIHFPIALYLAGVAFEALGRWRKQPAFAVAAFYNLTFAAWLTVPAIATGLLAWQWQLEGQRLKGVLLYHLVAAAIASVFIWTSWWLQLGGTARRHAALLPTASDYRSRRRGLGCPDRPSWRFFERCEFLTPRGTEACWTELPVADTLNVYAALLYRG
jgi:uncharacterized membrane protein